MAPGLLVRYRIVRHKEIHDIGNLIIRDKAALHAVRLREPLREEQHVALSQELFCAVHIQNGSGIHTGGNTEGNTAGHVSLDQSRNDVHGRTLRGDDQVDAGCSCQLGKAADGGLHVVFGDHHQIRQLVHNDDQLRHKVHDCFVSAAALDLLVLAYQRVVALDVANPRIRKRAVPRLHLRNAPVQRCRRLLRIGHHRNHQVRNAVVNRELHHLRIDHDELDLFGLCMEQKAHDDGIDADRFTGAGRTGDQDMRHFGDITEHWLAADVLTDRKRQLGFLRPELIRIYNVAQRHRRRLLIRNLNADGGLAGDRRLDADIRCSQRELDVICQRDNLADLDAHFRQHLIPRNRGPLRNVRNGDLHAEIPQRRLEELRSLAKLLIRIRHGAFALMQERNRREHILAANGCLALFLLRRTRLVGQHVRRPAARFRRSRRPCKGILSCRCCVRCGRDVLALGMHRNVRQHALLCLHFLRR